MMALGSGLDIALLGREGSSLDIALIGKVVEGASLAPVPVNLKKPPIAIPVMIEFPRAHIEASEYPYSVVAATEKPFVVVVAIAAPRAVITTNTNALYGD